MIKCVLLFNFLVHGLYKLHSSNKLHPPIAVFALEPVSIKVVHILHCGEKTGRIGFDYNLEINIIRITKRIVRLLKLTNTRTGMKSSAPGADLSWARLNRFMMIFDTRVTH